LRTAVAVILLTVTAASTVGALCQANTNIDRGFVAVLQLLLCSGIVYLAVSA